MDDVSAMQVAIEQARLAADAGDVPIGAVVVVDGEVVAARHNERELTGDPTAHAELLAIRDAAAQRDGWRLGDATVYVTLEPCAMCAGAMVNARIARVVFGAANLDAGATGSLYNLGPTRASTRVRRHRGDRGRGVRGVADRLLRRAPLTIVRGRCRLRTAFRTVVGDD